MKALEFDRRLSAQERRNVTAAYATIDAAARSRSDPEAARQALLGLLADDFTSFTPTSDPSRQQRLDKRAFINQLLTVQAADSRPGSELDIVAYTAHGNRVATEMVANMIRSDGPPIADRYHQLFKFNTEGQIVEYKTYMDSACITERAIAATEALARSFIAALVGLSAKELEKLLTPEFRFHPADGSAPRSAQQLLRELAGISASRKLTLEIVEGGLIAEEAMASVEAKSADRRFSMVLAVNNGKISGATEFASGLLLP